MIVFDVKERPVKEGRRLCGFEFERSYLLARSHVCCWNVGANVLGKIKQCFAKENMDSFLIKYEIK